MKLAGWRWAELRRVDIWIGGFALALIAVVAGSVLEGWMHSAEGFHDDLRLSTRAYSTGQWLALLLWSAVLGPALEELVFRGFLFRGLTRHWGVWPALGVSAFLFTLGHAYTWEGMLLVFLFGFGFGWLYLRTGSLVLVWLAHGMHNLLLGIWERLTGVL